MQILWLKNAVKNLNAIAEYIEQENPQAASQVVNAIVNQINVLSTQPALGRPGRVIGTRELVITNVPYLVPYRIKNNKVEILRIFHTSQKLPNDWA